MFYAVTSWALVSGWGDAEAVHRATDAGSTFLSDTAQRYIGVVGNDIITDFAPGTVVGAQDLMDVSGLGITAANFAGSVGIAASGANTLITIGAATIKLNGVLAASISSSDFVLG